MSRLHSHPLEFVALFLALGSVAYAAHIAPKNSVGSNSIRNGTITETLAKLSATRWRSCSGATCCAPTSSVTWAALHPSSSASAR